MTAELYDVDGKVKLDPRRDEILRAELSLLFGKTVSSVKAEQYPQAQVGDGEFHWWPEPGSKGRFYAYVETVGPDGTTFNEGRVLTVEHDDYVCVDEKRQIGPEVVGLLYTLATAQSEKDTWYDKQISGGFHETGKPPHLTHVSAAEYAGMAAVQAQAVEYNLASAA